MRRRWRWLLLIVVFGWVSGASAQDAERPGLRERIRERLEQRRAEPAEPLAHTLATMGCSANT